MCFHRYALLSVLVAPGLVGCSALGYPVQGPVGSGAPVVGSIYGTGPGEYYVIEGRRYHVMRSARGYRERGLASWYGPGFEGRPTSTGEPFDPEGMTAAHRTLPLGTIVRVRNLESGRAAVVRINDRGPFRDTGRRIIDLSRGAARVLGVLGPGTAPVEVVALEPDEVVSVGRAPAARNTNAPPVL